MKLRDKKYFRELVDTLFSGVMGLGVSMVILNDYTDRLKSVVIVGVIMLITTPIIINIREAIEFSKIKNINYYSFVRLELLFLGRNIPNILQILSFTAIIGLILQSYSLIILITGFILLLFLHCQRQTYSEIHIKTKANKHNQKIIALNARISGWFFLLLSAIIAIITSK